MAERIVPNDFYVYLHRKATTGEIFYVGKAVKHRAWVSSGRSEQWQRAVNKHGYKIEIVQDGLQEWAAFELEKDLISLYGKRSDKTGTLVNNSDGGDGTTGAKLSNETKSKMSAYRKGRKLSESHKKNTSLGLMGHIVSKESREKIRLAKSGKKLNEDHKMKIRAALHRAFLDGRLKNKEGQRLKHKETGFVFKSAASARRWMQDYFGLTTSSAGISTAVKRKKPYKGMNFIEIEQLQSMA